VRVDSKLSYIARNLLVHINVMHNYLVDGSKSNVWASNQWLFEFLITLNLLQQLSRKCHFELNGDMTREGKPMNIILESFLARR
jgi:hypothetical protein